MPIFIAPSTNGYYDLYHNGVEKSITDSGMPTPTDSIFTPELAYLNGRVYRMAFPPAFRDNNALYEQTILAVKDDLWESFPYLKFIGTSIESPFVIPGIESAYASAKASIKNANQITAGKLADHYPQLSGLGGAADLRAGIIDLKRDTLDLTKDNLSQYHKNKQRVDVDIMLPLAHRMIESLDIITARLGLQWSLRHPLAFKSSEWFSCLRTPATMDVPDYKELLGTSLRQAWTEFEAAFPTHSLFQHRYDERMLPLYGAATPAAESRPWLHSFQWWSRHTSNGRIWFKDASTSASIELVPGGIPPWLIHSPDTHRIPLITRHALSIPMPWDSIVEMSWYDDVDIKFKLVTTRNASIPFGLEAYHTMGHLLASIAYIATLFMETVRIGKGYTRPRWVQSPINAASLLIAYRFIHFTLRESDAYRAKLGV